MNPKSTEAQSNVVFHLYLFSLGFYFLPTITISYDDFDEVVIQVLQSKKIIFLRFAFAWECMCLSIPELLGCLELELQMAVNCLTQMQEIELWSSGRV